MSIVSSTLERLRAHLGLDIAYIAELDGDDMVIRALCAPDLPMELPEQFTLPREGGFCHFMTAGEIPQIVPDSSENAVTADLPTRRDFDIQSYIGVPLHRADGSLYGSICCVGHKPNHSLNDRDLRSIQLFAEIVVEQIDNELEDRKQTQERLARIRSAIDNNAFSMRYQPFVGLSQRQLIGFEVLCRFSDTPYRTPDKWFAEAIKAGLGVEMEVAVISKALDGLAKLPADLALSVNVSPDCLISDELFEALSGKPPERLILEITEHAVVQNYDELIENVSRYKKRGLRLAVDDVGAGYASLSHIVQLQPDIIKLDMSLTRDVNEDTVRRSLASALVHFAKETKAEILAEGVETEGECETLAALGVRYGQGYYFGKPLSLGGASRLASGAGDDEDAA